MNPIRRPTPALALAAVLLAGPSHAEDPNPTGPVPAREAAARMTVPDGFHVRLVASEPDVVQPIAFTIDPRGRLWVAECLSYPNWTDGKTGHDRIIILEDTNGDGQLDRRKVFHDHVPNLSGLELGFGGVWACATPNLLFIPDRDGDDTPDGEPEIKLDGWDLKAQHNVFNALKWGPDGWLWGCNGILSNSRVGRPGTPDDQRVNLNCGVWRYHPTRATFEVVAHGTTNPWGLDFDDRGEAFITNCVIPHLYRVVPGAHFQRMFGSDINPHTYELLGSSADHIHWAGGAWTDSRGGKGKHGEAGGGHAHAGAMIYLGDNWPDRYRDSVFMSNLHGHRVNHDTLARQGSGYVARHDRDFLFAHDEWFRGLELKYGPDGGVYLTDWSDTGECHENDSDGAHRENGRIYKITYGDSTPARGLNLAKLDDEELVGLQSHRNDWYVRTARRLLQERAAAGKPMGDVHRQLRAIVGGNNDLTRKLRALWALYVTGGINADFLIHQLDNPSEDIRAWAVRLLGDAHEPGSEAIRRFADLARSDPSALVRLYLASALQRLEPARRWAIAEGLVEHAEDAHDATLPLMIWYGVEPLVALDRPRAIALAERSKVPIVRRFIARRAVDHNDPASLASFMPILGRGPDPGVPADLLAGLLDSLRGRKHLDVPDGWPAAFARLVASPDPTVRERALLLALLFDDPKAVAMLRSTMADPSAKPEARTSALQALAERRVPGLAPGLLRLLDDDSMRGPALRALAAYDDPATPRAIIDRYAKLDPATKQDAIATLTARPDFASALLDAVGSGAIPRRDLNATHARQLLAFGDRRISDRLVEVWGQLRPTAADKATLMRKYKDVLSAASLKNADLSRGRLIFDRTCAQCHRLYKSGGEIGPDLTGSDRANLDYILENVLDPSAAVGRDYALTTIATADGRLISGIIREQDDRRLVIQTVNDRLILPREDIEELRPSSASMMPEGLLDKLTPDEVRDLVAYLASREQVPTPPQ